MKSAREIAHELANSYDASCLEHDVLGWSHGPRCDEITDAITRDRAARPVDVRAGLERAAEIAQGQLRGLRNGGAINAVKSIVASIRAAIDEEKP